MTIHVGNSAPVARDDAFQVLHDQALTLGGDVGVLANDDTEPGETLTAQLVQSPEHGTLTLGANGAIGYTPAAGYVGSDTFRYRDSDGIALSDVVQVTIEVTNSPAAGMGDAYTVVHDRVLAISANDGLLKNDQVDAGEHTTISIATPPGHGSVVLGTGGAFQFIPSPGFVGADSFKYEFSDGVGISEPITVDI